MRSKRKCFGMMDLPKLLPCHKCKFNVECWDATFGDLLKEEKKND